MNGKFVRIGGQKGYLRGVTYGTFRPRDDGIEFPEQAVVDRDFAAMAAAGIDTVRTYTVPPRPVLDAAARVGLRLMVGLAGERYVGYLNDRRGALDVEGIVREGVRACADHPALLGYVLGNEIPAGVVRWHGRRRIERYLERLWHVTVEEAPDALVTYANYPSTEYLQLDFLDALCFNVFLESTEQLAAYLKRLHNLAGNRPLLMGELGLDSHRHGEQAQARSLRMQVETAFASGCAGVFVYAWTDEWHTAAGEVTDWSFGLTRRDRSPKPALASVSAAFAEVPLPRAEPRPPVSVVICSYQGSRRLDRCLAGVARLRYPAVETIVVDDGSTDGTADVARRHDGVRVITTEHRGLSHARNVGMRAARGEIVAYLDDDAHPDPDWLDYLAHTFSTTGHVAVGGPNIAPPDSSFLATCIARSPGNPVHVLLSDDEAEHIPGCNMAFRRSRLEEIGGFDERFMAAGDDVDVCWRIHQRGWTIGFHPGAMVWHDPRPTIRGYLRQQVGYGRAEGLLERKWPEKYNAAGEASWVGRLYGGVRQLGWGRSRIYQGVWGQAPFQSIYASTSSWSLRFLTPQWVLLSLGIAAVAALGAMWDPLLAAFAALVPVMGGTLAQATVAGSRTTLPHRDRRLRMAGRLIVALLHLLQPVARLRGQVSAGLTPWRTAPATGHAPPLPRRIWFWSETWRPTDAWLRSVEDRLRSSGATVLRGGDFDHFDLEIRGRTSGAIRLLMSVEEHGAGRQLVRIRTWPRLFPGAACVAILSAGLALAAAVASAWPVAVPLAVVHLAVIVRAFLECAAAAAAARRAVEDGVRAPIRELQPVEQPG